MKNSVLPIGTIITVDKYDFMICGYFNKDAKYEGEPYDYICCLYPAGIGSNPAFIKKEQIEKVKFIGFQDARFVGLKQELGK